MFKEINFLYLFSSFVTKGGVLTPTVVTRTRKEIRGGLRNKITGSTEGRGCDFISKTDPKNNTHRPKGGKKKKKNKQKKDTIISTPRPTQFELETAHFCI